MRHFRSRRDFTCCDQCFDVLARRSPNLAMIWLELCAEYHREKRGLQFTKGESDVLYVLETNGYIVSTEDNKYLWVIPQGYHCEDDEEFFCVNYKKHSKEWEES